MQNPATSLASFNICNGEGGIRTRGAGLYPLDGLANQNAQSITTINNKDLKEMQQKTATKTAQTLENLPKDLQEVVKSWEDLPDHSNVTITTLIDSVCGY